MTDREEGQGRRDGTPAHPPPAAGVSPRPSSDSRGGSRCTRVAALPRPPQARACAHTRIHTDTDIDGQTHTHTHIHSVPETLGTAWPGSGLYGATLGRAEGRQAAPSLTPSLTVSVPWGSPGWGQSWRRQVSPIAAGPAPLCWEHQAWAQARWLRPAGRPLALSHLDPSSGHQPWTSPPSLAVPAAHQGRSTQGPDSRLPRPRGPNSVPAPRGTAGPCPAPTLLADRPPCPDGLGGTLREAPWVTAGCPPAGDEQALGCHVGVGGTAGPRAQAAPAVRPLQPPPQVPPCPGQPPPGPSPTAARPPAPGPALSPGAHGVRGS